MIGNVWKFNMKTVWLTVGISGSGKTTWANEQIAKSKRHPELGTWVDINRDYIRLNVLYNDITWAEYKQNKSNEKKVAEIAIEQFNDAVDMGVNNIIISDTNLNETFRNQWIQRAIDAGYEYKIVEFPITFDEACKRNSYRANGILQHRIYQQYKQWNKYIGRKTYVPNETKPKVLIVDIDGTVAQRFDRSPFDWAKVGQDKPRKFIIDLIRSYWNQYNDVGIIFVSGRDEVCRHETTEWIQDHMGLMYQSIVLHMRKQDDVRKDSIVKEEIFWEQISDNYNVVAVFDDRRQVVNMWHEIGIQNVIAVADQNIIF